MKYMGSKNRHAKELLKIILADRQENQWYVEPFCGGCNVIDKVIGNRIANDSHFYLIEMWKALQVDWLPPELITEELYKDIRINKNKHKPCLVGYVGFNLSFGGKWFGGYRRDKAGQQGNLDNMKFQSQQALRSISKQISKLKDIQFYNKNYWELDIPTNSIIYCDPPYQNTTKYKDSFDHAKFWDWCKIMSKSNRLYVSEYKAPDDFTCIWSKTVNNSLTKDTGCKQGVEKLFVYNQ